MQGVISANRSCFVSSVGVTVSTLESHASNPKFKSCWNLLFFFLLFCLVSFLFVFFLFLIQLLQHQNNQKCATFFLPLCQHQQQQSSFSTNIAVATAGILLCIFLDTRSADLCFTDKRYFLFSFFFFVCVKCPVHHFMFSHEKKRQILVLLQLRQVQELQQICVTQMLQSLFCRPRQTLETGSVRKRRKTDVGFITSSYSNRFVHPRQMLRALFYLPRQTPDSCSVMKERKRQVLVLLQVPAVLPVCDQVCPDITVMVNWAIILFYFSVMKFALV